MSENSIKQHLNSILNRSENKTDNKVNGTVLKNMEDQPAAASVKGCESLNKTEPFRHKTNYMNKWLIEGKLTDVCNAD